MSVARNCPTCGKPISFQAPAGFCPACELVGALEIDVATAARHPPPAFPRLRYFGDYELLEEIARGGMGVVYRARQLSLNRVVAIKMILAGRFASSEMRRRFRVEAEAAALLQHPNLVAIHEVGECEGQPYFSMDYVEGRSLAELSLKEGGRLEVRRAARWMQTIAGAIHYAHERGILHRDLKPSNVLIDVFDQPRITDFGLAKRLEGEPGAGREDSTFGRSEDSTITGQVVGSPNFMAPEQAMGGPDALTRAVDVYAVGSMLYYLVTGRPPFQGTTLPEVLDQVQNAEPLPPRRLNPGLPADLETICLKCLEKDPRRRYASGEKLAEDLGRFLRDEPILARPIGRMERGYRWARRHPALATLSTVVVLLLGLVALTSSVAAWRIARAERARVAQLRESYFAQAQAQRRTEEAGHRLRTLDALREAARLRPDPQLAAGLRSEAIAALALIDARPARTWKVAGSERLSTWAFSPNFEFHARVLETPTQNVLTVQRTFEESESTHLIGIPSTYRNVHGLTPDARYALLGDGGGHVMVYDVPRGRPVLEEPIRSGTVEFVGETNLVAALTPRGQISLWNLSSGQLAGTIAVPPETQGFAFSPDGSRLALRLLQQVIVRETGNGRRLSSVRLPAGIARLAWSGDNSRVIASCLDRQARLWRAEAGEEMKLLFGPAGGVVAAQVHSVARLILTAELERTVRLWDLVRSKPILNVEGSGLDAHFSSDGRFFGPVLLGERMTIYEILRPVGYERLAPDIPETRFGELSWSPDGQLIATATPGLVRLWNVADRSPLAALSVPVAASADPLPNPGQPSRARPILFDALAGLWAETGQGLVRWPIAFVEESGERLARVGPMVALPYEAFQSNSWHEPAGALVARALFPPKTFNQMPTTTNPSRSAQTETNERIVFACLSPDRQWTATVAFSNRTSRVRVQSRHSLSEMVELPVAEVRAAHFSSDNRWLVTAGRRYAIWEVGKWTLGRELESALEDPTDAWAEFAPDGKVLALVWDGRTIDLRRSGTWDSIARLEGPDRIRIEQLRFSPDGKWLAAGGREGSVQLWDLQTVGEEIRALGLAWSWGDSSRPLPVRTDERALSLKLVASVPARSPQASRQQIDLTDHYNAGFDHGWFYQRWNLAGFGAGLHRFQGMDFDARGVVQLSSSDDRFRGALFPPRIRGVQIRQAAGRLHFLHGCINRVEPGTAVAHYLIHYREGETVRLPVIYGEAVRDTYYIRDSPTVASQAATVWEMPCDNCGDDRGMLRLFQYAWTNPEPSREIEKIDFVSGLSGSGPFLVALTVEPPEERK